MPFDLIPLFSFILRKARCRYCRKKISWQYPLVELATGLIFLAFSIKYAYRPDLFIFIRDLVFASFLMIIFVYDLKWYLILDKVSIPAFIAALLFNLLLGYSVVNILLGVLIGGGFFLAQFLISKGKWVGGGDIRLGALMGAMLGWRFLLGALFLAYISGAIVGSALILMKKKEFSSSVPFGAFLAPATLIMLLAGGQIIKWYLNFF